MARCNRCGAETVLYVKGVPICVECDAKVNSGGDPSPSRPAGSNKPDVLGKRPGEAALKRP